MALRRQSQHSLIYERLTLGNADERRDFEDKIAKTNEKDATGEHAILDQTIAGCARTRSQKNDLLIQLHRS